MPAQGARKKLRLRDLLLSVGLTAAIAYFGYHSVSGGRGLFAMFEISHQLEVAQAELDDVRAERLNLEHRVNLLYEGQIDPDLLDEQARYQLGYAADGEIVTYLEPEYE